MDARTYLCIDLKSFYASVECVDRGLDPMTAKLVVADPERSEKTICLAVSPALKKIGVQNRCRVFQIPKGMEYIMAPPRMKRYIEYSAEIYGIYLKYIAKEDIHVYSIDEAFLDVTDYLSLYQMSGKSLAVRIMEDIRKQTGIPATAGVGTNLYLAKIALDITAKHVKDNIGFLDEESFQNTLWNYKPLTDFWRIGRGTAARLGRMGIFTMKDITEADEDLLYKEFGVDAELLIDHAWGRETTTMRDIKEYKPKGNSLTSGQVLPRDYEYEECKVIIKEMTDELCMSLFEKGLTTNSLSLMVGYSNTLGMRPVGGTASFYRPTDSYRVIVQYILELYEDIVEPDKPIRRLALSCNGVKKETYEQMNLFTDYGQLEKDKKLQQATWEIKKRYGKNAVVRGMDLQEFATAMDRNRQIGGHKSGE